MPDDQYIDPLHEAAERVIEIFSQQEVRIATVESCTGGMISAALTDIAGSSNVLDRGYSIAISKKTGKAVTSTKQVKKGDAVRIRLAKGQVDATVVETIE